MFLLPDLAVCLTDYLLCGLPSKAGQDRAYFSLHRKIAGGGCLRMAIGSWLPFGLSLSELCTWLCILGAYCPCTLLLTMC